jgi:hypothetical protein
MTEWNIQPRASACTNCQSSFADKAVYHTFLLHTAEGYRRRDLCPACCARAERAGVISYWQGEYRVPPPPPPEPIGKDTAETLLKELVVSTDPAHAAPRYILAVMLERKKLLKHRDTVRDADGRELLLYEHAQTGDSFSVPDPHLRLDQLEDVQRHINELLQSPPPSQPAPAQQAGPAADPARGATAGEHG